MEASGLDRNERIPKPGPDEMRAAHERMEAAEQFGKIVLTIPD